MSDVDPKPKLLVIENNKRWRDALAKTYAHFKKFSGNTRSLDFEVAKCEDYESAIGFLDNGNFHAVSLDWHIESQVEGDGVYADSILEYLSKGQRNTVVVIMSKLVSKKHAAMHKGRVAWQVFDKNNYQEELNTTQELSGFAKDLDRQGLSAVLLDKFPELLGNVASGEARVITPDMWWTALEDFSLTKRQICAHAGNTSSRTVESWNVPCTKSGHNENYYLIKDVRRSSRKSRRNLEFNDKLLLEAIENELLRFKRYVRPPVSESDWLSAVGEALVEGKKHLSISKQITSRSFREHIMSGFSQWLKAHRRQLPFTGADFGVFMAKSSTPDDIA